MIKNKYHRYTLRVWSSFLLCVANYGPKDPIGIIISIRILFKLNLIKSRAMFRQMFKSKNNILALLFVNFDF